jgi:hypothetical protein
VGERPARNPGSRRARATTGRSDGSVVGDGSDLGVRPKSLTEAERAQRVVARAARTAKGNPEQEDRLDLAALHLAANARPADVDVDPGFQQATFIAVFKKCSVTSGGGWAVLMEVPNADQDAFYPVTKATEIELLVSVLRKPTTRPGRARAAT